MTVTQMNRKVRTLNKDISNIRARQIQTQAYVAWPWQPRRESMRPVAKKPVPTSRPKLKTTNQCTFVAHKTTQRPKATLNRKGYHAPSAKMLTETTYDTDFTEKTASRPAACKPKEAALSTPSPFDSKTVYEKTYTAWTPEQTKECKVQVKVVEDNLKSGNPGKKFQTTTTVKEDYIDHGNVSPAKSTKPAEKPIQPTARFADETTHRADFTPKAPPSVEVFKPKEEYKFNSAPFDDLTIFRRDFPEHRGVKKEQSYKPKNDYSPSASEFDDRTTQRMAYQAWPIPKREHLPWAERQGYIPNRGKLQLVTSYQSDFEDPSYLMPKALFKCRATPYKYDNNLGAGESGPFDDRTEYRSTFIAWDGVKRPASYKIIEKYKYPETPFSGESTFTSHFKGVRGPPAKSCRPATRPHSSSAGMISFDTTYRATFDTAAAKSQDRPKSCPTQRCSTDSEAAEDEKGEGPSGEGDVGTKDGASEGTQIVEE
ncbi:stabilizer of axonemal microtubules 2-like isoform X2 [Acanthaster planci]|uniref:Stabilizer of axonemal microtubules 2-like isoform X2 n=1 Tax=Acanthaster planci TaxID=133434 RepID=A0A8B7YGI3_ACAPL|nr:stabilizer of axonemal microtubules 2-like isoform X2 [Acanthaster planci]